MNRALRARWRRLRADDSGMTLIELMVTMILLAVVSTLVVTAVSQAGRILTHTDDEATGLGDAKVILDRLGRDIRESRSTVCDGGLADPGDPASVDANCNAHLQLWIDANSDYAQQESEVVTWRLQQNPDGVHFDVWRITGVGPSAAAHRQASSLIVQLAFEYDTGLAVEDATEVTLSMQYDAIVGRGTAIRDVAFAARLRNKG